MAELVFTAVGPDKKGLVGVLAKYLHGAGANLADSRMVNLRGQFALVALAEGDDDVVARVREGLPAEASKVGLRVTFASDAAATRPAGVPYRLKTYSMDQPGIVSRVTEILERHGANVEELESAVSSAPFDGGALFSLEVRLTLPRSTKLSELRADLDAFGQALNCDLDLEPGT